MPTGFTIWVGVSVASELAAGTLSFALTWVASGYGAQFASAVLVVSVAPSVVFGLLGGAAADRYGPRRMMVVGTIALMITSSALGAAVALWGTPPWVLLLAAALIGMIAAFYRPAVGVFPRLFVADADLGAAMARVGVASQIARTVAPPLGGLLIGLIALSGIAVIDVLACAAMLGVLLLVRPARPQPEAPEAMTVRGVASGISVARRTPGVPTLLAAVAIVAGAVIPAVVLGIPLAARERGWSAAEAGIIEAGWIAGGLVIGGWYAVRGTSTRAWIPMTIGPVIIAGGLLALALADTVPVALLATCVIGAGVVVFTAHLFPTYVLLAPDGMLSRFQSLLIVCQQAPQLLVLPAVGALVAVTGAGVMFGFSALAAIAAGVLVVRDRALHLGGKAED
mgnify:CR=1 FL=1